MTKYKWILALLAFEASMLKTIAQDSIQDKHSVYIRIATSPITDPLGLMVPSRYGSKGLEAFLIPVQVAYGKMKKGKSEFVLQLSYFRNVGNPGNFGYSYKKGDYTCMLSGERRWYIFPKEKVRPFGGIYVPVTYSHNTQRYSSYLDNLNPGGYTLNTTSIGLGASAGFRVKHNHWNFVFVGQWHIMLVEKHSGSNTGFDGFSNQFFLSSFQLGYSF